MINDNNLNLIKKNYDFSNFKSVDEISTKL